MASQTLDLLRRHLRGATIDEYHWDDIRTPLLEWADFTVNDINQIRLDLFGSTYSLDNDGHANLASALYNVSTSTSALTWIFSGAVTFSGSVAYSGTATFSGNVRIFSGFDLLMYSDAGSTLKVSIDGATGNTTLAGTLGVTGASTLASLSVTGAATVGTTLGVTGATTLSSTLSAGASTLASLSVTGAATVGTTLGVTGATTFTGAVTLPATDPPAANTATQKSLIKAWSRMTSTPTITNSYNISSASKAATGRWNVVFNTDFDAANYPVVANSVSLSNVFMAASSDSTDVNITAKDDAGTDTDVSFQMIAIGVQA